MAGYGFGKENRLRRAAEFDRVFKNAHYRVHSAEFLMLAVANDLGKSRLGTVVSKRAAGNAVERNRIRRLLKETFRRQAPPGLDIVVVARNPVRGKDNATVGKVLAKMWHKLDSEISPDDDPATVPG